MSAAAQALTSETHIRSKAPTHRRTAPRWMLDRPMQLGKTQLAPQRRDLAPRIGTGPIPPASPVASTACSTRSAHPGADRYATLKCDVNCKLADTRYPRPICPNCAAAHAITQIPQRSANLPTSSVSAPSTSPATTPTTPSSWTLNCDGWTSLTIPTSGRSCRVSSNCRPRSAKASCVPSTPGFRPHHQVDIADGDVRLSARPNSWVVLK